MSGDKVQCVAACIVEPYNASRLPIIFSSFSDHCPLYSYFVLAGWICFKEFAAGRAGENGYTPRWTRGRVTSICTTRIRKKISWNILKPRLCNKIASLETDLSTFPATECAHKFTCLLQDALQVQNKNKGKNKNTFPRNMWFDEECKEKKKCFKKAAKRIKENPNNSVLRELMWKERNPWLRKKKRVAISKLHTELMEFKNKNPQEFWQKISKVTKQETEFSLSSPPACFSEFPELLWPQHLCGHGHTLNSGSDHLHTTAHT